MGKERIRLINDDLFEYQEFDSLLFLELWSRAMKTDIPDVVRQKFVDGVIQKQITIRRSFVLANDEGGIIIGGVGLNVSYGIEKNKGYNICLEEDKGNLAVLVQHIDENNKQVIYRFFQKK